MAALPPNARVNLATPTARHMARQKNAEQVQSEADADRQAFDERTARLRALRLDRESSRP